MSNSPQNPPNFPEDQQFDGTNYVNFKSRVLIAARGRGARGYLDGTIAKPLSQKSDPPEGPTEWVSTSPSLEEWEIRDAWALGLIIYNTKNPIGYGLDMDGTAAEAWAALNETYGTVSDIAAIGAETALRATMYSDGMDFLAHTADLRTKWKLATEKGAKVDDATFRSIVMASMPESWNSVIAGLYATKTSAATIAGLTIHWDRVKAQSARAAGPATTALVSAAPQKPKLVCTNTEHCGRTGHTIENCYWKGGGKEGQFPANFRNRRGHTSEPQKNTPAANLANTNNVPAAHISYALLADTNTTHASHISYALLAHNPNNQFQPAALYDQNMEVIDNYLTPQATLLNAVAPTTATPTFADSGASDHCFVERKDFEEYQSLTTPRHGQAATRGATFSIVGKGTVKKHVTSSVGTSDLAFHGALHTPQLAANLISVGKFDAAGCGYKLFDRGSRSIITSRDVVFEEGIGHRTIALPADDDLLSTTEPITNANAPAIITPGQPVAPRIRPTDGPLHTPAAAEPARSSVDTASDDADIDLPIAQRRVPRTKKTTPALTAARETLSEEKAALTHRH
ncbi:hypothetical protein D9615_008280 [Tricholomella constricta]|uniref:Retrovirus-related Pol polyprotein from transposon TNT 1-94-like beta-barrel domain-containing protein n=1 Tax=Tricholomella constricta TaxID=117010 RepID=A0A8H5H316_9AGAR|nr:hypothetical protein D9615_008280 [Tricholomella constricta]